MPEQLKPHYLPLDTFLLDLLRQHLPAGSNLLHANHLRKTVGDQMTHQVRAEIRLPTGEEQTGLLVATTAGVPESADVRVIWTLPTWSRQAQG
ncbi:hypothetical protein [Deinococcus sp. Leaf326]|uniref:hypothetical protein n=1 Tax=Deinococcus sp. Leaf326 TaxID=1736338 RepID=UPI0006F47ADB|nr:hypothetical protein [Deinococcus sp. Leaf326]KQR25569.1 hypothetical protein ASF71_18985 [Deinococcus sp. Leaf326]